MNISNEEYRQLRDDSLMLEALREAGVDNWSGYEYAMEILVELREDEDE